MRTTPSEAASVMAHLVTLSTDRPGEAFAEFRIGVRSLPYLADHGFQDMVVLPGSFYVEIARCVDRALSQHLPGLVQNVTFHSAVILGADETVIRVDVRDLGDGRVEYGFYEGATANDGARPPTSQYACTLEVDRTQAAMPPAGTEPFPIAAFQAQAQTVIGSEGFYKRLRDNGNQYGPSFQRVASIWRAGDQSLARLAAGPAGLDPSLLDAMTQLLAPFVMERGKTFILHSIERVTMTDGELPDALWGQAELLPQEEPEEEPDRRRLVGRVRVFDQSGKLYVELSGVTFTFLDPVGAAAAAAATTLVVASNFTADPIEDSLRFWGDHFGTPVQVRFAPYDQIFQQLLDRGAGSAFRGNRDGVNIILLGLEEWAAGDRHGSMTLDKERVGRCFAGRQRYVLPNGLEIVHLNRYETDYVYKEIFEDQCYLRHGISLPDGATVVDIGANVGLFSLFVLNRTTHAQVFAFEPAPMVYDLLKANCDAYGSNVRAFNLGVSDKPKTATFTFYEKSSVFSSFHADTTEDRKAIQAVVRNTLSGATSVGGASVEEYVPDLTADRLRRTTHQCRLTSVSEIIRENRIERIDLLKIDAEKSELDIIRGIGDRDWPRIEQIVVEVHDRTGAAVKQIARLLAAKGYRCAVEAERLLEDSGLFHLYATRREAAVDSGTSHPRQAGGSLERNVRDFSAALRQFMQQATAPLVLCVAPRSPGAIADANLNAALDAAEQRLWSETGTIPGVHPIRSTAPLRRYPVEEYYDPHGHHLGHIPYTSPAYAAIGTALFRTIFSLSRKQYKAIVLDCDNTLWQGVCGEDGPLGIDVSMPYRRLQEFMIGRLQAGMLLCLCSKNNERDVLDVFEQRADMVLKREHLVSWRINWNSKSANVKSLARELNLGLDSFIFIDDNPVDCADVRINCPGVLTLQLPPDAESFSTFLDHVWAFDHAGGTDEDHNRTRMYRENAERAQFREQTCSLKDFVQGLQLRVDIREMTVDQLSRVSQLTYRTNQFNFTTVRRSEQEIREFVARDRATCLVVHVVDRFGDYGIVGVVMYEAAADRFTVDTFALSCRVLGRGVEHAVLADLGRRARADGKRFVALAYRPTERNAPAREFITRIGERAGKEAGGTWTLAAERLARLEYNPDDAAPAGDEASERRDPTCRPRGAGAALGSGDRSEALQLVAQRLYDIDRLTHAIDEYRLRNEPRATPADAAASGVLDTALLDIWRKVLGRPRIGMNDNFFDVGGTSLRAVQVIATIKRELQHSVSIVTLFECPTVTRLAARLRAVAGEPDGAATSPHAAQRGQRRRKVLRRKAS